MNKEKISITWFNQELVTPSWSLRGPMRDCAMIAPTLPDAALMPKAVDRYRVGKTSPGTRKVVVFGPKF